MIELLAGERHEGESKKAVAACNDYLRMGVGRSLQKVLDYYQTTTEQPPVKTLKTIKKWSRYYGWQDRVAEYDARIDQQKTAEMERRRLEAMQSGIALDYERVLKLKGLFDKLEEAVLFDGLYYTDLKLSANGKTVSVETFNKALIDEFRGVLDDIAKETGGRRQGVDVDAKLDASVKGYVGVSPDDWDDTTETD